MEAMEREREKEREAQKVPEKWDERKNGKDDQEEEEVHEWRGKALVKPDIVFFGFVFSLFSGFLTLEDLLANSWWSGLRSEMLSDEFDRRLLEDREEVDLLIVIGTSLRVRPLRSPLDSSGSLIIFLPRYPPSRKSSVRTLHPHSLSSSPTS